MHLMMWTLNQIDSGSREIGFTKFNKKKINILAEHATDLIDFITSVDDGVMTPNINFHALRSFN